MSERNCRRLFLGAAAFHFLFYPDTLALWKA